MMSSRGTWLFLSTPSARRATSDEIPRPHDAPISIHALREEGDLSQFDGDLPIYLFLSTPSARRATANLGEQAILKKISIHALREEGDS